MAANVPISGIDSVVEGERLRARLSKLAEDKSNLQLVAQLMERLNPLSGVEDMVHGMLTAIVDTIGGTNIKLYYWIDEELHYADFFGQSTILDAIDDPMVARVVERREFVEQTNAAAEALLRDGPSPGAWTWGFPLMVGAELLGVVKIENLHISGASLRAHLPVFFSHAALLLSNEIRNEKRQRAQLALRESELRYRQVFGNVLDSLYLIEVTEEGRFRLLEVNPTFEKALGIPRADLLGRFIEETAIAPEMASTVVSGLRQFVAVGDPTTEQVEYPTPIGRRIFRSTRVPMRDENGRIYRIVGILHDITEQKQIERERLAHLRYFENMDRIYRAMQGTSDVEQMARDVLDTVLDIFGCDRAFLAYPCDPEARSWRVSMERTRPGCPGIELGTELPMEPAIAEVHRRLLASDKPVQLGLSEGSLQLSETARRGGVRSLMAMAIYPKADRPWEFGIQQCSFERVWTAEDERLFQMIGRRLDDALTMLLAHRSLRESEERFRLVFENSPVSIWEEDFSAIKLVLDDLRTMNIDDIEGYLLQHPETVQHCAELVRVVDINAATLELHEARSKEELLQSLPKTFSSESYSAFRHELVALWKGETELVLDGVVKTLSDKLRHVTVYFSVCPGYEKSLGKVLVSLIDITERKAAEDSLRLAGSVFANSQEGILISDAQNTIIDVNPAFTQLTGYTREEARGKDPHFLTAGRQSRQFYDQMWREIQTKGAWQGELWNRRKSGKDYVESLSISAVKDERGVVQHYVGVFSDISVFKAHEAELDHIAHYDQLTGVPNRRLLADRLDQAIARSRRVGKMLALCYLDLDGFKPINDEFGHEVGDRLLVEITHRLQDCSRADDTLARLGGDEFVLLWNDIEVEAECFLALDRILKTVSVPIVVDGAMVSVSASIGVTLFPDDNVDADSLLRHADHAMYSAKQMGKNRYQLFDSRLERQIFSRNESIARIARALEMGQLELQYQPKVDWVEDRVVGVEALIRWREPTLGLLGPREFLPLIENDNLAYKVGQWVMAEALRQGRRWHIDGVELPISINVFPRHLRHTAFVDDLRQAIATEWPQIPAGHMSIEVVETADLEDLDAIEAVIKECADLGVAFSLDDFGTGYSSLVHLRRLSVAELKIDQSFVRDMMTNPADMAIVVGVIGLGKAFGLRVVAEGVESEVQAHHLVSLGCKVAQGYGIGRPMPVDSLKEWLLGRSL
jgi:diguanylate cyclase (GGDEF)-like protein/PAS domain S-box-containing protein